MRGAIRAKRPENQAYFSTGALRNGITSVSFSTLESEATKVTGTVQKMHSAVVKTRLMSSPICLLSLVLPTFFQFTRCGMGGSFGTQHHGSSLCTACRARLVDVKVANDTNAALRGAPSSPVINDLIALVLALIFFEKSAGFAIFANFDLVRLSLLDSSSSSSRSRGSDTVSGYICVLSFCSTSSSSMDDISSRLLCIASILSISRPISSLKPSISSV
mmetsp:Transcript_22933/g.48366  ORF Transcript_22933/g.48366 Transcript_22933/m.48366 type:complete len:218 (+) Transcript_22933:1809-2462(+)